MERALRELLPRDGFGSVSPKRSRMMRGNRGRNTTPEVLVRQHLHRMGYRFRLHRRDLPGCPDIVLPKYKTVIFVHGCYWHRHGCSIGGRLPKTRTAFWMAKFARNVARDVTTRASVEQLSWTALVVWECETKHLEGLQALLSSILDPNERQD